MTEMSKDEIRNFLMQGTFTGKLATVNNDGSSSHVVPIWFVLDEDHTGSDYDIVCTTGHTSVKAKNILRNPKVSICVDDQTPPFSFVTIYGIALTSQKHNELLKWATRIAERYMGKSNAEAYGKRNSAKGELLVRIKPTRVIAEKDIASWD